MSCSLFLRRRNIVLDSKTVHIQNEPCWHVFKQAAGLWMYADRFGTPHVPALILLQSIGLWVLEIISCLVGCRTILPLLLSVLHFLFVWEKTLVNDIRLKTVWCPLLPMHACSDCGNLHSHGGGLIYIAVINSIHNENLSPPHPRMCHYSSVDFHASSIAFRCNLYFVNIISVQWYLERGTC